MAADNNDEKQSVIVGLGTTGLSVARYLAREGEKFMVVDSRQQPPGLDRLTKEFPHVQVELGNFNETTLAGARRLIVSPGVSLREPALAHAVASGVPVTGDVDIFSQVAGAPIVAVTGSNGKSTVVTLIAAICRQAGIRCGLGGNLDGANARPALDLLAEPDRELFILELSSFQLETTAQLRARVAVILNLSEDHLDRYDGMQDYLQAKQKIFNGAQMAVINRDSSFSRPPHGFAGACIEFGLGEPGPEGFGTRTVADREWLAWGDQNLLPVDQLKVFGRHNVANVLAAMAVCRALGVELEVMKEAVTRFSGLPHRCQWLATIDGADFYNDSKGTNVGATVAAVEGLGQKLTGKIVLIAGGIGKGADFSPLRPVVQKYVRAVVLIGKAAGQLAETLSESASIHFATDMEKAVERARLEARPGDAVLLSPACASFDMFRDFNHRGEVFAEQVRRLQ